MLISIITVSYNNSKGLITTLSSIKSQIYKGFEVIVIDGGSTDDSREILQLNEQFINKWVSEPDNGIYDAMNKGVNYAKGDWIIFMNAGDTFADNRTLELFINLDDINGDLVFGDNYLEYENDLIKKRFRKSGYPKQLWKKSQFSHQSLFSKRELLLEHPFQYIDYKIAADAEFFIWAQTNNKRFQKLDIPISITSSGGISDTERLKSKIEYFTIVKKYYSKKVAVKSAIYLTFSLLIEIIKLIAPKILKLKIQKKFMRDRSSNSIILMIGSVPPPMAGQPIAFKALIDNLPFDKIIIDQSNTIRFLRPLKTLVNFLRLILIFIFIRPKIIYFQSSRTPIGALRDIFFLVLKNKNAKVINHLHGADFKSFYYSSNRLYRKALVYAYSKIDISIVLLEKMKEQYEMFPKMDIVSVPNFYPNNLDKISLPKTILPITILYLSNIMYSKGIIDLLDALGTLRTYSNKIETVIAGKFVKDEFKSENEIKELFLDKYNHLKSTGFNINFYEGVYGENKIELLKKSDIFILPTFYKTEAFPISILEAMRTGNIIISTKHNYIEEIIGDSNGKLIDIRDIDDLARTIIHFLNNIDQTEEIKRYNLNYARENYSTEQHVKKVEQLINSLNI